MTLPHAYRAFVIEHNGGPPIGRGRFFAVEQAGKLLWMQNLTFDALVYSQGATGPTIVDDLYEELRTVVPPGWLPIGSFEGDIEVLLCTRSPHEGQIWVKPLHRHSSKDVWAGMQFAAASLPDFLNALVTHDPGDAAEWYE